MGETNQQKDCVLNNYKRSEPDVRALLAKEFPEFVSQVVIKHVGARVGEQTRKHKPAPKPVQVVALHADSKNRIEVGESQRDTGTTLVTAGVLAGNGVISGPVTVGASGTLSPGAPLGPLTVNNTVTLGGTTMVQISRTGVTLTNGLLVASTINFGGSLVVTNIGPDPLAAGDTLNLFDATTFNGTFSSFSLPPVGGLTWDTSKVAVDGTITLVAVPQFTGFSLSGSTLTLSGTGGKPSGNYYLLGSTNVAAPVTNWVRLQTNLFDGSGNFSTSVAVSPATPKQYFRLLVP